jgi:TRAP-type C4-dicarboxylate transport system permease small subunit
VERLLRATSGLSRFLYVLSGIALVWMMLVTVADVLLRSVGRPLTGAYEVVSLTGPVVVGLGLPYTSWKRGHVYMEFLLERFPKGKRKILNLSTRLISIVLFAVVAYNLLLVGVDLRNAREVSPTLEIPFYPIAYGVGVCFFMLCLVLVCDIARVFLNADE